MDGRSPLEITATPVREAPTEDSGVPAKPRILVVDDSEDVRTLLQTFFGDQGFEVMRAASGAEALEQIAQQLPQLVICDYSMPGMTGLELCQQLRSQWSHIPIIVYTGTDLPHSPGLLHNALCRKPADLEQLARMVHLLLGASQSLQTPHENSTAVAGSRRPGHS